MASMTEVLRATHVVLTPADTRQIGALGWRVTPSVIGAGSSIDEKQELEGVQLREGQEVIIDYSFGGRPASVKYVVNNVQPPDSSVGIETVVEIRGEEPNDQERLPVRATLQYQLQLMEKDLDLAREENIPATPLEAQVKLLRESLQSIF